MSQTTQIQKTGLIKETEVSLLDADSVIEHAEKNKSPIPEESTKLEIQKQFASNPILLNLCDMHKKFLNIKNNLNLLSGLTDAEKDNIRSIISQHNEFKQKKTSGNIEISDMKKVIASEKVLAPLSKTIEWWTTNTSLLKGLDIWENLGIRITVESKQKNESDSQIKIKVHNLTDIKNEWISHQQFSGCTSSTLLDFYENTLCGMENLIIDAIRDNTAATKKWPPNIKDYLKFLLFQLNNVKKNVLYSMYYRLAAAEFYEDLEDDDLMHYTSDRILEECQIDILKKEKRPAERRSLSPAIAKKFVNIILEYCKINKAEKSFPLLLNKLKIRTIPKQLQKNIDSEKSINDALNYPGIIFAGNIIPSLLDKAYNENNMIDAILNGSAITKKTSLLNKILYALNNCQTELDNLNRTIPIWRILDDLNRELRANADNYLKQLSAQLDIKINKQMNLLMDMLFGANPVNYEIATNILDEIENANQFYKIFLKLNYTYRTDIILAMAQRLKSIITSNQEITPFHITNIIKLIKHIHPEKSNAELLPIQNALTRATTSIQPLIEANEVDFLHLLTNLIETPLLSREQLPSALIRHHYISAAYEQKWDDRFNITTTLDQDQQHIFNVCSYISNVSLKITSISSYTDLSNFDSNPICTTLNEMEARLKKNPKALMNKNADILALKIEYESAIANQLNDFFQIKSYLYSSTLNRIDLNKLKTLIARINQFFIEDNNKKILLEAVSHAVESLIKKYCLFIMENNLAPDITYIDQLDLILGEDSIKRVSNDSDILKTIESYIETNDGTSNILAYLFKHIVPVAANNPYTQKLERYAKKRLDYILLSRRATVDDYYFFNHYENFPTISSYIRDVRNALKKTLDSALAEQTAWDPQTASLMELFADKKSIFAYRAKRIQELLKLANELKDESGSLTLFNEFHATVFKKINNNKRIIDEKIQIDGKTTFDTYLHQAINTTPWSLLLEKIIGLAGSKEQLQQLHFNTAMHLIENRHHCGTEWLGKTLAPLNDPELHANANGFLIDFFGEANIQKLTEKIEALLGSLTIASMALTDNSLPIEQYKQNLTLIACAKPLSIIYLTFGKNASTKSCAANLTEMENKLLLHSQLHNTLKSHTSLLNISANNDELHNLILSIIQSIINIEDKNILSGTTINDYLHFIDTHILSRISSILEKRGAQLNYETLYTLVNLSEYFSSERIKMLLVTANKNEIPDNPHWLTLINHLDDKHIIQRFADNKDNPEFLSTNQTEFQKALTFASHLINIQHQTKFLIKQALLQEAGMTSASTDLFKTSMGFDQKEIKDKQLLKLWFVCANKLTKKNIDHHVKPGYIHFLVRIINKVSFSIFERSRNNPALLSEQIHQLPLIRSIKKTMKDLDMECDKSFFATRNSTLWLPNSDFEKIVQPLFSTIDKATALNMQFVIEKYAASIISKSKLVDFKKYCNDSAFQHIDPPAQSVVKNLFVLKKDKDAAKITRLIDSYIRLSSIVANNTSLAKLAPYLDQQVFNSKAAPELLQSTSYQAYLLQLKEAFDSAHMDNSEENVEKLKRTPSLFNRFRK